MSDPNKKQKLIILLSAILGGIAVVALALYFTDLEFEDIKNWIQFWTEKIQALPAVLFFLMLALLPLAGFPITPLFIIAGVRFGIAWAIPFSLTALAANLALAHWISTRLLHSFIQKLASKWDYDIPKVGQDNAKKWILVIRLCGAPLAVQNYILGLSYVPFWPYLWISVLVQAPVVIGIIVFGESFLTGNFAKAFLGVAVLVIALVAVSFVRKRYAQPKPGPADTTSG